MAQTRSGVLARIVAICEGLGLVEAVSPFDFTLQPTGTIDGAFRLTVEALETLGGTAYSEEHTDQVVIWIARKQVDGLHGAYAQLVSDVSAVRSAVVRDGSIGGGEFAVEDGGTVTVEHVAGQEFAVARIALPVNYEVQL
jgi:hypothetical protein